MKFVALDFLRGSYHSSDCAGARPHPQTPVEVAEGLGQPYRLQRERGERGERRERERERERERRAEKREEREESE